MGCVLIPNRDEHCKHSFKNLGFAGEEIHLWMDTYAKEYGFIHRIIRHRPEDLELAIELFGPKYGDKKVRDVFYDHLILDGEI